MTEHRIVQSVVSSADAETVSIYSFIDQERSMHKRILSLVLLFSILLGMVALPPMVSAAPRTPGEVPDTLPPFLRQYFPETQHARSEERRVGKECRSRWSPYQ